MQLRCLFYRAGEEGGLVAAVGALVAFVTPAKDETVSLASTK